mgnify:CR=1 FL=1
MHKIIDTYASDILSSKFLQQYVNKKVPWGFNGLGYIIFKRTYARTTPWGSVEEWWETIARCINGAQKIGAKYSAEEAERLYDLMFNLKCFFSGRGLWQLGTKTVDIIGMDSLLSCWVTKISSIQDFVFVFTESMLGGGVGCNISREYTQELPRVKKGVKCYMKNTKDADFIIPDSKEGWSELYRRVLESFLITGNGFSYSNVCIRPEGEPLKTFGGIAPGPKPLTDGIAEIIKIFERRENKKLRTQDVADIICCAGQIVKSGGIRRTALILLGDPDDISFLNLKRWDIDVTLPSYRSNSNNSMICSKYDHILDKYWEPFDGRGEAYGLFNLKNAKRFGRLGELKYDGFDLFDSEIIGVNPCAEALLADKESCNLAEIAINNISSKEEMFDCAKLLYKAQKAVAAGKYLHKESTAIINKCMRLGLGVTGICQKPNEYQEWCDYTYRQLRAFDKEYSKVNNWPQSIRLTVCKPSGTVSLLSGSSPGGNCAYSKYHIRTVRFSSMDKLVPVLREAGYFIEPEILLDGKLNHDIVVVHFPCQFGDETICFDKSNAIEQLERIKSLQTVWADQAVSNTVYYKKEEIPEIKEWLKNDYDSSIKTLSFLLHIGHGFRQAVLQEITEQKYNELIANIKPIKIVESPIEDIGDSHECQNGMCPIK